MVLLGIVPVLTQAPPTTSRTSITATRLPDFAPWMAARCPAGPEPMTRRSKVSIRDAHCGTTANGNTRPAGKGLSGERTRCNMPGLKKLGRARSTNNFLTSSKSATPSSEIHAAVQVALWRRLSAAELSRPALRSAFGIGPGSAFTVQPNLEHQSILSVAGIIAAPPAALDVAEKAIELLRNKIRRPDFKIYPLGASRAKAPVKIFNQTATDASPAMFLRHGKVQHLGLFAHGARGNETGH